FLPRVEPAADDPPALRLDVGDQWSELVAAPASGEDPETLGCEPLRDRGPDVVAGSDHGCGGIPVLHARLLLAENRNHEPTANLFLPAQQTPHLESDHRHVTLRDPIPSHYWTRRSDMLSTTSSPSRYGRRTAEPDRQVRAGMERSNAEIHPFWVWRKSMKRTFAIILAALAAAALFGALVHAVLVAAHVSEPAASTVYGLTAR